MCDDIDLEPLDAIVARLVERLGAGSSVNRASAPHGSERGGGPSATVIEFRKKGRAEAPPVYADGSRASGGFDADAITAGKAAATFTGIAPELENSCGVLSPPRSHASYSWPQRLRPLRMFLAPALVQNKTAESKIGLRMIVLHVVAMDRHGAVSGRTPEPKLFARSRSRVRGPAGDSTVPPCRLRLVGR